MSLITRYSATLVPVVLLALVLGRFSSLDAQAGKIEVLWPGQAATRITTVSGKVIVIDPFLTQNPKTPAQYKNLDALGKVDLILVTHAHGDHLGDGPDLAKKHKVPLWAPSGLDQSLVSLGVLPVELAPRMNKGGTITPLGPDIKITMTRAEHSSELLWTNPATGKPETHVGGEPARFIIEFENGFKLYHMGDTGVFADMKWIGEYYKPDLILIPIGGHFVMSPKDAAVATEMISICRRSAPPRSRCSRSTRATSARSRNRRRARVLAGGLAPPDRPRTLCWRRRAADRIKQLSLGKTRASRG